MRRSFALRGSELEISAQVLNVLDTRNVCCVDGFEFTPQPDGSVDTRTRTRGGLSRFGTLGVVWFF